MSLANVNIGTTANDGTGDPLRAAFNIINQNFANLAYLNANSNVVVYSTGNANLTVIYNPGVASVAGRTGNVTLTITDVIGAASIGYVNAMQANTAAVAANLAANLSTASVDANVAAANVAISNLASGAVAANVQIAALESNAAAQAVSINSINSNVIAANTAVSGLTSISNMLIANAAVQTQLINLINANVVAINVAIASFPNIVTVNANVTAANLAIAVLESNAVAQAVSINSLGANITAANADVTNGLSLVNANVTAANAAISTLQSNAATQAVGINSLVANITAANVEVASLRSNAGAQASLINIINANVSAANLLITALQSNADSQQASITDLAANSATQESSIFALRANITAANAAIAAVDLTSVNANVVAANAAIATLQSNAGVQATAINSLTANITASNVEVTSLRANAGVQGALIISLQSNAGSQSNLIDLVNANVIAANLSIISLESNAGNQADSIASLFANAATQTAALATLTANAATQTLSINDINANIAAANLVAAAQTSEITSLRANITASNVEVVSLRANAGVQAQLIGIINSNVAAANIEIANLYSNAAIQAITLANLTSNAGVQATTLINLDANVGVAYNLFALGNAALANTANVQVDTVFVGNVSADYLLATNKIETETFIRVGPAHDEGETWANPGALFFGNTSGQPNTYYQINLQNVDPEGSGDLVVTADDGNDGSNYINLGINNSNYSDINYPGSLPHDGYVYIQGGNLYITSANDSVMIGNVGSNVTVTQTGFLHLSSANLKFIDNTIQTTAYNAAVISANIGVVYDLIELGNIEFGNVNANISSANVEIVNLQANIIGTNVALASLSSLIANTGGVYGDANVALYLLNNTANVGNLITTGGVFWANGEAYSSGGGSSYGNTEVAAYLLSANAEVGNLTTAGTITASGQKSQIRFHWDTLTDLQNEVNANVWHGMIAHAHDQGSIYFAHAGAWQPVANQSELDTITANVGAYQTYANATFGTSSYGNANVQTYLGQFDGNIIPNANVTYSLGSEQFQWKDLWVSNNTIYIGNTPIRVDGGSLLVNNVPLTGPQGEQGIQGNVGPSGAGSGDVNSTGGGYVNNAVVRYNGTSGNVIQNSLVTIANDGAITAPEAGSIIPFLWADQAAFPPAANNHGAIAHSHADGRMYFAHGVWIALANLSDVTYGNANVATYLSNYDGSINFTASPAIITGLGNISSANFTFGNGVNILSTVSAGSYGNANVASYLLQFDGDIEFTSSTAKIGNVDVITVLDSIRSPAYQFSNGTSIFDGITGTYSNANVAAYLTTANISTTGNITAGNVAGTTFTGNLEGRVLRAVQAAITTLGTLTNVNTSGNVNVTNTVNTGAVIASGNITAGNISTNQYNFANGVNILSTVTGTQGNVGPQGEQGEQGIQGNVGPQGETGTPGAAASISFSISASGSADYVFSGPGIVAGNTNDPVLYLYRGFTYVFVNTTGGSHPFAIRVSNGGASYTPGVSGSTTGTQTFVVPMNAPATLYYQCTLHSGMGNVINIV